MRIAIDARPDRLRRDKAFLHKSAQGDQAFCIHLAPQIRTVRADHNLSLSQAAHDAGLIIPTVRSVESGTGSVTSMMTLIDAYGAELRSSRTTVVDLGTHLASVRKSRGISQRGLASMIAVSQPTVISLEIRNAGRMANLQKCLDRLKIRLRVHPKQPLKDKLLVPGKNDEAADLVYTPPELAKKIIARLPLHGDVLDPCRGSGAFWGNFPEHVTPLWCEVDQGRDFFDWNTPVDWIVTNPLWSKMREFLEHGMAYADNVVYLAAFTHFTTSARVRMIRQQGFAMRTVYFVPRPEGWPQSGFQMAAVWLQRGWDGPCDMVHID